MAASHPTVDPTTTIDEEVLQLIMKIQTTIVRLVPSIDQNLEPRAITNVVQTLNNSMLSTTQSSSFSALMEWLSLDGSTVVFNKKTKVVMF